jgi:anti-sigma B factor antagonist
MDAHTCGELSETLDPLPQGDDVSLDLSGVSFMDSSGIRVLVDAHNRADAVGRRLVIEWPSSAVQRVLEISGLVDHLNVVPANPE